MHRLTKDSDPCMRGDRMAHRHWQASLAQAKQTHMAQAVPLAVAVGVAGRSQAPSDLGHSAGLRGWPACMHSAARSPLSLHCCGLGIESSPPVYARSLVRPDLRRRSAAIAGELPRAGAVYSLRFSMHPIRSTAFASPRRWSTIRLRSRSCRHLCFFNVICVPALAPRPRVTPVQGRTRRGRLLVVPPPLPSSTPRNGGCARGFPASRGRSLPAPRLPAPPRRARDSPLPPPT